MTNPMNDPWSRAKTFDVYRAQSLGGKPVPEALLCIGPELPEHDRSPNWEGSKFFEHQAKLVHQALASLPQGTKHQLLILLLQEKVELYHGP